MSGRTARWPPPQADCRLCSYRLWDFDADRRMAGQSPPAGRESWSLERIDSATPCSLAFLIAGLQTVRADIGMGALKALQSLQPGAVEGFAAPLLDEPTVFMRGVVLVLDHQHPIEAVRMDRWCHSLSLAPDAVCAPDHRDPGAPSAVPDWSVSSKLTDRGARPGPTVIVLRGHLVLHLRNKPEPLSGALTSHSSTALGAVL